jgi:acyl-CoA hydrolase
MEDKKSFECKHSFTVFPNDLNFVGTLFGGKLLAEMDIAAAKLARRLVYNNKNVDGCVTVSSNCEFHKPAMQGDIIKMTVKLKTIGRSSLGMRIKVDREDMTGFIENIATGNFTFVSVKDKKSAIHDVSFNDEIIMD